jgi:glycosyltransferase involved in cell wall biosynthesis
MAVGFLKRALIGIAHLLRQPVRVAARRARALLQRIEMSERFGGLLHVLRRIYEMRPWSDRWRERRLRGLLKAVPARRPRANAHVMIAVYGLGAGGAERQVAQTVLGLAARLPGPLTVTIEAPREESANWFYADQLAHAVPIVEAPPAGAPADPLDEFLLDWLGPLLAGRTRRYRAAFRAAKPDIVHAWLDSTNICAGIAAVAEGVPHVVLSARSVAPTAFPFWRPFMRPAYRAILAQPGAKLLNNSEAGLRDYAKWLGVSAASIGLIRNGVALDIPPGRRTPAQRAEWRARAGVPPDGPIVGGVFRIGPEKRPSLWLDVARRVAAIRPDTRFVVVGGGPHEVRFMRRAAGPEFGGRVHALGPRKDALEAIAAMDVLLHTSRIEGSPNVPVEAQLLGVPVVATPGGGTAEAVGAPPAGRVANSADPGELARLVLAALDAGDAAAQAGPAFALRRFGPERMIDETLAAYQISGVAGTGTVAE